MFPAFYCPAPTVATRRNVKGLLLAMLKLLYCLLIGNLTFHIHLDVPPSKDRWPNDDFGCAEGR